MLVRQLAQTLEVRGAWVTEWLPGPRRLRSFSFWLGDGYFGDFEYDVAGTPCERVVTELRVCHVPDNVIALFPERRRPRHDQRGQLPRASRCSIPTAASSGHVGVVHGAPLPPDPRREHIVSIFAGRAGAELRQLRRDGEIAARQEKLTRLLDGTVDAIVELDADRTVTQANDAALQLFGRGLVGRAFDTHLTPDSAARLHGDLCRCRSPRPHGVGGLPARRPRGCGRARRCVSAGRHVVALKAPAAGISR